MYHEATPDDLQRADARAAQAFATYGRTTGAERAQLLRRIAAEIEALGDTLLSRFVAESALPRGRAESECRRTCDQLRLFATAADDGSWVEARIDPHTRSLLRPIGPVVVFGPANFPLAFGVAGGDTASALAVGCPVIVKAHPSHPETCKVVGGAVTRAVEACGLPPGVFTLAFGGPAIAAALVQLPSVRGVGFTGSSRAGHALLALCQRRTVPIPFFGELSGINPLCILPEAMAARAVTIARGLHASMTMGVGQFCTKPGVVFYVDRISGTAEFRESLIDLVRATPMAPMLNATIRSHYGEAQDHWRDVPGVATLVTPSDEDPRGPTYAGAALFACEAATFRARAVLSEELFGPATLLVACRDVDEMVATVCTLAGQLTATIHEAGDDLATASALLWVLEQRAGRIVFNGYPTGVEVVPSMVHGGPWPATTDSRFTSVGTAAMRRFTRPICYQNAPERCLPEGLKDRQHEAIS